MTEHAEPAPDPHAESDARQAQAEVQQLLASVQTQALYDALVAARIEIARLHREATND